MKARNICVVTGSRAEYGLLVPMLERIQSSSSSNLQLIVTGMHLSSEYGNTYRQIERDGFVPVKKIDMQLGGNSPASIGRSIGVGLIGFADALAELDPDLVVLLGDRFELLSVASAALVASIPIIPIWEAANKLPTTPIDIHLAFISTHSFYYYISASLFSNSIHSSSGVKTIGPSRILSFNSS